MKIVIPAITLLEMENLLQMTDFTMQFSGLCSHSYVTKRYCMLF